MVSHFLESWVTQGLSWWIRKFDSAYHLTFVWFSPGEMSFPYLQGDVLQPVIMITSKPTGKIPFASQEPVCFIPGI